MQKWSDLIWSVVADDKCFGLICIWIVFVWSCIRSESLKVWLKMEQWRYEGQFIGNDSMRIWRERNQNIGTQHYLKPPWTSDLSTFWNKKIIFVYWKFSCMYSREPFDMGWNSWCEPLCKIKTDHSRRSELLPTNHFFVTFWQYIRFRWDKAMHITFKI